MSSVVSLSESTRLDEVPENKLVLGQKFRNAEDGVKQANRVTDELANLANSVDGFIRQKTQLTNKKIKYLTEMQGASRKFWSIVGTTLVVLVTIRAFEIAQYARAWFKQREENAGGVPDETESPHVRQRLHARDWVMERSI
jgi:hypothetical protein